MLSCSSAIFGQSVTFKLKLRFRARNPARPRAHGLRAARYECDQSRPLEFWREAHRTASANSHRAEQRTPGSANLLGRKRGHDFLETRIATQRVKVRV